MIYLDTAMATTGGGNYILQRKVARCAIQREGRNATSLRTHIVTYFVGRIKISPAVTHGHVCRTGGFCLCERAEGPRSPVPSIGVDAFAAALPTCVRSGKHKLLLCGAERPMGSNRHGGQAKQEA